MKFMIMTRIIALLVLLLPGWVAAQEAPAAAPALSAAPPATEASPAAASPSQMDLLDDQRQLLVGETVTYSVIEEREPAMGLVVGSDKKIDLPLLGKISVDGLTCRQAAKKIQVELEKDFFHHATVILKTGFTDSARGTISLWGEIRSPGTMSIPRDRVVTVVKAIMERGGFTENANKKGVVLRRLDPANPGEVLPAIIVDAAAIESTGDFSKDIEIKNGDTIMINSISASEAFFTITGEVNNPGMKAIPTTVSNLTVRQAIQMQAGGFTKWAKTKSVLLIRADDKLPPKERRVTIDASGWAEGTIKEDPLIRPGDTIKVDAKSISF